MRRLPFIKWKPKSNTLTYLAYNGSSPNPDDEDFFKLSLWSLSISDGKSVKIGEFDGDFFFDWSYDGKQLAYTKSRQTSDVVLINFK
jgi:Tol biopolymer transport system component